jgi:radical SAM protein with 4Fe4S-binding SPASM domain
MSPEVFSAILFSIRPYTDYIYLHVLGEPLLHPQLSELLEMAEQNGFHVNMTTNGSLIVKRLDLLRKHTIRQFNISLHDAEENIPEAEWGRYLQEVFSFADEQACRSYFSFRLWNEGSESSMRYNAFCEAFLKERYGCCEFEGRVRSMKLSDHIFLQRNARFDWPDGKTEGGERRNCFAMRDQIAILVDGTVVPCCLDADAQINLGNILEQDFKSIIESERAVKIAEGFRRHVAVEPFCKSCGFVMP